MEVLSAPFPHPTSTRRAATSIRATPASIRRESWRLHSAFRLALTLGAVVALAGCGGGDRDVRDATFSSITADPAEFDGRKVTFEAAYYGAFEVSVLTSGFAESFPPQPIDPQIWVGASPPEACLERAERSSWADAVEATGTFRYDPDKGFGHLGAYDMALENARMTCL